MLGRYVVSLGDGIDSITAEHRGRTIFQFDSDPKSELPSGEIQYEVSLIDNYSKLYQALGLNTALTASIPSLASGSMETDLIKNSTLTKESVSILIKGTYINNVEIFPQKFSVPAQVVTDLNTSLNTFVTSHGDSYISQVMYGKKFYALINFSDVDSEQGLQIKQQFEAALNKPTGANVTASATATYQSQSDITQKVSNINLVYTGVAGLPPPKIDTDITGLYAFIDKFNATPALKVPIAFYLESYATLIQNQPAADIFEQIKMVKALLLDLDQSYNRIRLLLPSIQDLMKSIQQIDSKFQAANSKRILQLSNDALAYQNSISEIITAVELNKTDLTLLPEKLTPTISIDKSNMPKIIGDEKFTLDQLRANQRNCQLFIMNQLNIIKSNFTSAIMDLEFDLDEINSALSTQVLEVTHAQKHFHLSIPANSLLQWNMKTSDATKGNNNIIFDLQQKKSGFFHSYNTVQWNINNGGFTKITALQPQDSLRLKFHAKPPASYSIGIDLMGPQALTSGLPTQIKQAALASIKPQPSRARVCPTVQYIHLENVPSSKFFQPVTKELSGPQKTPAAAETKVNLECKV